MRIGTDIVKISRFEFLDEVSLKRIFHPSEMKDKRAEHLAGVFAVKECLKKIFECDWLDVEIKKRRNGRPYVVANFKFKGDVSISHDGEYAVGVVLSE